MNCFSASALLELERHDRVGVGRDRVRVLGRGRQVRERDRVVLVDRVDRGGRGLDAVHARHREVAGRVLDVGHRELVGERVGEADVADRPVGLGDRGGDAVVAVAADPGRELDLGRGADLRLPLGADRREVVGERVGVAAAVAAVDRRDLGARQADARVELGDRRVVPLGDLAEVDVGEDRTAQLQPRGDTGDVVGGNRAAQRPGDLLDIALAALNWSAVSGASEAPKSTVRAVIWSIPPPLPIAP